MLVRDKRRAYRTEIEKDVGKDATGKQVLDHIFGTYDNDYSGSSDIVVHVWVDDKRGAWQHLNMFWAMPLTLLIATFQYVISGQTGWDSKSKVGRFILRVTGHLKES